MTRLQGEDQIHLFRRAQAHYLAIGGCYEVSGADGSAAARGLERGPI